MIEGGARIKRRKLHWLGRTLVHKLAKLDLTRSLVGGLIAGGLVVVRRFFRGQGRAGAGVIAGAVAGAFNCVRSASGAPNLAIILSIWAIILSIAAYIALRASMRSLLVGSAMVVARTD
jgi:hypothetical protein